MTPELKAAAERRQRALRSAVKINEYVENPDLEHLDNFMLADAYLAHLEAERQKEEQA